VRGGTLNCVDAGDGYVFHFRSTEVSSGCAAVGVYGQWTKLSYGFFVGAPVREPEGFRTAKVTLGFNLNASF
jgi:hemolysin activation/secretion protein